MLPPGSNKNNGGKDVKKAGKTHLVDNSIYLEANKHNISYKVVDELNKIYYENNGSNPPSCLADLLEVLC